MIEIFEKNHLLVFYQSVLAFIDHLWALLYVSFTFYQSNWGNIMAYQSLPAKETWIKTHKNISDLLKVSISQLMLVYGNQKANIMHI